VKHVPILLVVLFALALSPPGVLAGAGDTQEFLCERDSWLSDSGGEVNANMGATDTGRGAKGWGAYQENTSFFDWDFAPIEAFITAQMPAGYYPVFTLSVMPATWDARYGSISLGVRTVDSVNDWAEGDATSWWTPFDWSPSTKAATVNYAQHALDAGGLEDLPNSLGWGDGSQTFPQAAAITSTNPLVITGADLDTYVSADLSYTVMQHMRDRATTNNRGLYLTNTVDSNWELYMREHLTGGEAKLTVSFSDAPMPDYLWNANGGNWTAEGNWDPPTGGPPRDGDVGVIDQAGRRARADGDLYDPGAGQTAPGEILIQEGGILELRVNTLLDHNLVLDGGILKGQWDNSRSYAHDIRVKSDSNIGAGVNGSWCWLMLSGPISDYDATHTGVLTVAAIQGGDNSTSHSVRISGANNTWTGGTLVTGAYLQATATGALGTGPANVTGGTLGVRANAVTSAAITCSGAGYLEMGVSTSGNDIHLDGGNIYNQHDQGAVTADDIALKGDCTFWLKGNATPTWRITGTLSDDAAPGKLILRKWTTDITGAGPILRLDSTNTYSGGTDIHAGRGLIVNANQALGTGAVNVYSGGYLYIDVLQDYAPGAPPAISAHSGGTIELNVPLTGGVPTPVDLDVVMNGGILQPGNAGNQELSGDLILAGNASIGMAADKNTDLTITGQVRQDGGSFSLTKTHGTARLILANGANDYTGGTIVKGGTVEVTAAGALSTGSVEVAGTGSHWNGSSWVTIGGRLLTSVGGALDSVSGVTVNRNGVIEFDSVETKPVAVNAGGAVRHIGNQTYDFSATGNVAIEAGAILDESVVAIAQPLPAEIGTGDDGFGVYLGRSGAVSDDYTVAGGNAFGDGGGTIFRGLAALNNGLTWNGANLTYTGTAESTGAIENYCQTGSLFTFQGCTLNPASPVDLNGDGNFTFVGAVPGGTFTTVNKYGAGYVQVANTAGLTGKTVNVHEGYLDVNAVDALDGATANIESGGAFRIDQDVSAGDIVVKDGGGVYVNSSARLTSGAAFDFQVGSQALLEGNMAGAAPLPGGGTASYTVFTSTDQGSTWRTITPGLVLGDTSRLTVFPDAGGYLAPYSWIKGGPLTVAGGHAQGRIAMHGTGVLRIETQVNFPDATLVIGDTQTFSALKHDGRAGYADITQDGTVDLMNDTNVIKAIDIQAGTLMTHTAARTGGAASIRIAENATWYSWNSLDLATVVSGTGTASMQDGARTLTLTPSGGQAAGISPGDSAGTLNVAGNLALSNDGVDFATLDIEVVSAAAVDKVAVTGNLDVGAGNLAVTMGLPSVNYKPADLSALEIATCGGTLTGPFNAITTSAFDSVDPSPSVRAAVAAHWTIEADDVTYGSNNIVLDGSNWTGFAGDADLSDFVDLADLSTLAFNWEKSTGMTWLTADFDLNGVVNLADLSALAFHWEQSASAGAPPVPEPMTVGLLVLGGAALLRRRR